MYSRLYVLEAFVHIVGKRKSGGRFAFKVVYTIVWGELYILNGLIIGVIIFVHLSPK